MRVQMRSRAEFVPISERPEQQIPLMMNPNDPRVREYALGVLRELAQGYDFDGFIWDDRLRYGNLNADFSPSTRAVFEKHVGKSLRWPDDVFRWTYTATLERGLEPGPYYERWLAWRASVLRDFLRESRRVVGKRAFGVYAGSWYGEYQNLGNNWAAPSAQAGFWFLTPEYARTGFAPDLDFLITGCYYPTATTFEALRNASNLGHTVEAAGVLSNRMVDDATWTYAGIALSDFKDNPSGLQDALQAALSSTQGVMVFDLSHDIDPMWPVFAQAFANPATAPHRVPGLLAQVRRERARESKPRPPVLITTGRAGAGQ
jgi:hypothetical protein